MYFFRRILFNVFSDFDRGKVRAQPTFFSKQLTTI